MTTWEAVTWDVTRAGGFTAYILLTLSVAVGLALTLHWQSSRWPRIINAELHNFLSLLSLVFVVVHVLAALLDPFTTFGIGEVLVPFASHYRPLWMALGIVGLYLGLAVAASTLIRPRIGYAWWRRIHVLTLVTYALVTVHGLATGSDTRTSWGAFIYFGSIGLVAILLWMRLVTPATPQGRPHPVLALLSAGAALAVAIFTFAGPMRPGWNAIANNGNGTGERGVAAALATPASPGGTPNGTGANGSIAQGAFSQPFNASLSGTFTQSRPDAAGNVTITVEATLGGGASGNLGVTLEGPEDNGGITIEQTNVTLGTSAQPTLYSGQLSDFSARRAWRMGATLSGGSIGASRLQVLIILQVSASGEVSGSIQGSPVASSSSVS